MAHYGGMTTTDRDARRQAAVEALRAALGRRNIGKADLVRLLDGTLSKATVYRYWNGERDIAIPDLMAICAAAGISEVDVLADARKSLLGE